MTLYTHTVTGNFVNNILKQLDDVAGVFWTREEVLAGIREGLDVINSISYFQRDKKTFLLPTETNFLDLHSILELESSIQYVKTVVDLKTEISIHLLENAVAISTIDKEVFDNSSFDRLIENKIVEFLLETNLIKTQISTTILNPPLYDYLFSESLLSLEWLSFLPADGNEIEYQLARESEDNIRAFFREDSNNQGVPSFYSETTTERNRVRFYPGISEKGQLRRIGIEKPDYSTLEEIPIPSNFSWVVKYGVLYEIYNGYGQGYDAKRAEYCKQRWQQGISLCKNYPLIIFCRINGLQIHLSSLKDLDFDNDWVNREASLYNGSYADSIYTLINIAWNLVALPRKLPANAEVSVDLDILGNTILPSSEADYLQITKENIQALNDYVLHYLYLKLGDDKFYSGMNKLARTFEVIARNNVMLNIHGNEFGLIPYENIIQKIEDTIVARVD